MPSIVLVEDLKPLGLVLLAHLRKRGWTAELATGGKEGLTLTQEMQPEMVLVDLSLPDLHGLQLIELLVEKVPQTRIVAMSGMEPGPGSDLDRALRFGAVAVIAKPFGAAEMLDVLEQALHLEPPKATPESEPTRRRKLPEIDAW